MADLVDLRSDTVTKPTAAMRRAMFEADVGDDGFGEDPTVNRLEEEFAALLGLPGAVFVPAGTMGNQIALRLLGAPATRVVTGRSQHVVVYEHGAAAVNANVQLDLLDDAAGVLDASAVAAAVVSAGPRVSAVFIENTHMEACGTPWSIVALDAVVAAAGGAALHMDGARLFNASVATGVAPGAYAARASTVMCCLSKGLAAPVGSLLAGRDDLADRARIERKRLGGGMRQAGVLAAAGLVALRHHVERLADDHARARLLAEAVADRWPGCLDPGRVRTNIVVWPHPTPAKVVDHLGGEGVLVVALGPDRLRIVTHLDVDDASVERARRALASAP
jgi:threonine aldolase